VAAVSCSSVSRSLVHSRPFHARLAESGTPGAPRRRLNPPARLRARGSHTPRGQVHRRPIFFGNPGDAGRRPSATDERLLLIRLVAAQAWQQGRRGVRDAGGSPHGVSPWPKCCERPVRRAAELRAGAHHRPRAAGDIKRRAHCRGSAEAVGASGGAMGTRSDCWSPHASYTEQRYMHALTKSSQIPLGRRR